MTILYTCGDASGDRGDVAMATDREVAEDESNATVSMDIADNLSRRCIGIQIKSGAARATLWGRERGDL